MEMKNTFITNLFNYPKDGNHLELYNETSFQITKGSDQCHYKNKWYTGAVGFRDVRKAYLHAIREDMIICRDKMLRLEELEKDVMNEKIQENIENAKG